MRYHPRDAFGHFDWRSETKGLTDMTWKQVIAAVGILNDVGIHTSDFFFVTLGKDLTQWLNRLRRVPDTFMFLCLSNFFFFFFFALISSQCFMPLAVCFNSITLSSSPWVRMPIQEADCVKFVVPPAAKQSRWEHTQSSGRNNWLV